ncbi:hypothetical protein [Nocardia sp. NPDC052566]|uniref:hypothetical protein n=1 Tax=Nocardia sp. NPDC052566 TaxID=3364330 RepID=UPI0037CC1847
MTTPEPEYFTGTAISRSGLISVETTETGLPTAVDLDPGELRRNPEELAHELLRLFQRSTDRARLARRAALTAAGVAPDVMDRLGLPTADAVADTEARDEEEVEYEPGSWLRNSYE